MGGSRVQVNKAHKTRFSSKSSRKAHRVPATDKSRIAKADKNAMKGARAARIQRCKMLRDQKRATLLKEKRSLSGPSSPPRVIVLCGLSASVNLDILAKDLRILLSGEESGAISATVASQTYKLRTTVLMAPYGGLVSCIELAKVADLIAFVVSANSLDDCCESLIDSFGTQCLSVFRAIGFPSTTVLIRDIPVGLREKQDVKKCAISCLGSKLPEDCRFYPADTKEELHKFMWLYKEQHLSAPHWRSQRSYILSQEVALELDNNRPGICTLLLSGYVRARNISVNQLVHVSGAGDFQLDKIDVLRDPMPLNERKSFTSMDSANYGFAEVVLTIKPDASKQEPLVVENIPDPLAGEQTWPTEADMEEADENNRKRKLQRRKLPPGTSNYQAAWIVDNSDDDASDGDVAEDDGMVLDGLRDTFAPLGSSQSDNENEIYIEGFDEKTEADSEMADDANMTREQIEAEIKKLKDASGLDEEFPDEVDTPLDIPARKRFAKYRGLKSFRTSSWDPQESLPPEYARIFNFDNFTKTQNHVLSKAQKYDDEHVDGSVQVGSYVRLHVKDVPVDLASKVHRLSQRVLIVACGLLQHESKMSVLHFSIKKHDSYGAPIKSKETFTFHVGFRQFVARPIFSTDNINSDKHKLERFLLPGRFSVASIYAPICFTPMPLVALKNRLGDAPTVAAVGSLRTVDPYRIILKKIVLTGYPLRVSKKKATVRYMFHNPDDVRWFKPIELYSKCGRRGLIKDSVGTHGLEIGGELNLVSAIQIAQLALKHRQNKNQQQRIIVFAGSPTKHERKLLETVGRKLKKNSVALDIVDFGESDDRHSDKLGALVAAVNNNGNSHMVSVPPGSAALSDALLSTPVFTGDGNGGSGFVAASAAAAAGGTSGFEFGVDPNIDPELALALRVSMEEERARQEAAAKKAAEDAAKQEKGGILSLGSQDVIMVEPVSTSLSIADDKRHDLTDDETALLRQALAMSMDDAGTDSEAIADTDMSDATADDQDLAFALKMSVQEDATDISSQSDMSKVFEDQSFVSSILNSLPGVDPNDPSVKDLLASLQSQSKQKDEDKQQKQAE